MEQGRRKPSGPAEALLRIAEQKPEVFTELAPVDAEMPRQDAAFVRAAPLSRSITAKAC